MALFIITFQIPGAMWTECIEIPNQQRFETRIALISWSVLLHQQNILEKAYLKQHTPWLFVGTQIMQAKLCLRSSVNRVL